MSEQTVLNPLLDAIDNAQDQPTWINPSLDHPTSLNPALGMPDGLLEPGTVLGDGYRIEAAMDVAAGEADIYICVRDRKKYVAKIYRRRQAVKPEVVHALRSVNSAFVAPLFEVGEQSDRIYAILPYYANGSLHGKRFSLRELKHSVIPCINQGLKDLHKCGIIHKDLKPSNIMETDDGRSFVIIDFGISSVVEDGSTVILTRTGLTPEYAAPETHNNLFLEESDYYSLGVTLYELYTGRTPYHGLDAEQIAQYTAVQRIPFPENMPCELQDLITALTYYDITKRNDLRNPNRRWTHDEVQRWCEGRRQPVPGEGVAAPSESSMPPYTFLGKRYTDVHALCGALATNWDEGKRQLYRGLMSSFFRNFSPEVAGHCLDAEEAVAAHHEDPDVAFWKLLYQLDPQMSEFYWRGKHFASLADMGHQMRAQLMGSGSFDAPYWDSVLENRLLSAYLQQHGMQDPGYSTFENVAAQRPLSDHARRLNYYVMAYVLSGERILTVDGQQFATVRDLTKHMSALGAISYDSLTDFSRQLIRHDNSLSEPFEAWLTALGKGNELNAWRKALRAN